MHIRNSGIFLIWLMRVHMILHSCQCKRIFGVLRNPRHYQRKKLKVVTKREEKNERNYIKNQQFENNVNVRLRSRRDTVNEEERIRLKEQIRETEKIVVKQVIIFAVILVLIRYLLA